jgi:hypothetical protein
MEGDLMTTSTRKIKTEPFVMDLRNGLNERELMEKYTLSESQLHKLLHKLVDAGAIDEMELFMRTSLTDSAMTRAFGGTQCPKEKMGYTEETISLSDPETASDISLTEQVTSTSGIFRRMLAKLGRTGS